jgi:hypothetical protein
MNIPRFQGKAIKVKGGWTWECFVTTLGSGDEFFGFNSKQIFKTKQEAIDDLKEAIQDAIKQLAVNMPGSGISLNQYIDMKTNKTRLWDKSDEH